MRLTALVCVAAVLVSLVSLGACERDRILVISTQTVRPATPPGSNITEHQFITAEPCLLSDQDRAAGTYASAKVVTGASAPLSARAKAEKVEGCASVKFHLAQNGTSKDVQIVNESPAGYGFGTQVRNMVEATIYAPPKDENSWYYQTTVITRLPGATVMFSGGPEQYAKYAGYFLHSH